MRIISIFAFILSLVSISLTGYLMQRFDQSAFSLNQMISDYEGNLAVLRESSFMLNSAIEVSGERLTLLTDNMAGQIKKIDLAQTKLEPTVIMHGEALKNIQRSVQTIDKKWEERFAEISGIEDTIDQASIQNKIYLNQIRYLVLLADAFWSAQGSVSKALNALSIAEHTAKSLPAAQYQLVIEGINKDIEIIKQPPNKNSERDKLNHLWGEINGFIEAQIIQKIVVTSVPSTNETSILSRTLDILSDAFVIRRQAPVSEVQWNKNELAVLRLLLESYILRAHQALNTENEAEWLFSLQQLESVIAKNFAGNPDLVLSWTNQVLLLYKSQIQIQRKQLEYSKNAVEQAFQSHQTS